MPDVLPLLSLLASLFLFLGAGIAFIVLVAFAVAALFQRPQPAHPPPPPAKRTMPVSHRRRPPWLPTSARLPPIPLPRRVADWRQGWKMLLLSQVRPTVPTPRHAFLRAWAHLLVLTMTEEERDHFQRTFGGKRDTIRGDALSACGLWPWVQHLTPEDVAYMLDYIQQAHAPRWTRPTRTPRAPWPRHWRDEVATTAPLNDEGWEAAVKEEADTIAPRLLDALRYHLVTCPAGRHAPAEVRLAAHLLALMEDGAVSASPALSSLIEEVRLREGAFLTWCAGWLQATNTPPARLVEEARARGMWPMGNENE